MRRFPRIKSGERLTPRHLNVIYAELERLSKLSVVGPATLREGPEGVRLVVMEQWAKLVKPSSTIAAMTGAGVMTQGTALVMSGIGTLLGTTVGTIYPYNAMGTTSGTGTCLAIPDGQRWLIVGRYC